MDKATQAYRKIKKTLKLFPEVVWDRFSGELEDIEFFGWIAREDGRHDFFLLHFVNGEPENMSTSSAKYSAEFCKRLDWGHNDCKRVEHYFTGINCIRKHQ